VSLPWLSADDYFVFRFELATAAKKQEYIYAQAVVMFDDAWLRRVVRVFNFRFVLVDSARRIRLADKLYGSLSSVGLFIDLLRNAVDQLRIKSSGNLRQVLINQFKDIIAHFRLTEVSTDYNSSVRIPLKSYLCQRN
jgi:hypothetical protein